MISTRSRKAASVALVAVGLLGIRAASAGGADLGGQQTLVGSDSTERCSSAQVQIDYDVAYDAALQGYGASVARLCGLGERCLGHDVVVTLNGPGGVPLAELTAVVTASEMDVVVPPATPVAAERLTGVSVVLSGAGA